MTECNGNWIAWFHREWNKTVKELNPEAHKDLVIEETRKHMVGG